MRSARIKGSTNVENASPGFTRNNGLLLNSKFSGLTL